MISIRPYGSDDKPACRAIYFANLERQLIPVGYDADFEEALDDSSIAKLVAVVDGGVVACGGICYYGARDEASLSYGLVHPDFQRRRIGTSVLLARLSLLEPTVETPCDVSLCATQYSKTFFMKHGFAWCGTSYDEHGNALESFRFPFTPQIVQGCKDALAQSSVAFNERPQVPMKS